MILIEIKKDNRTRGYVDADARRPGHWRWLVIDGALQSGDAYPTYAEALEALFEALGWDVT
jgi:hypothetical protein